MRMVKSVRATVSLAIWAVSTTSCTPHQRGKRFAHGDAGVKVHPRRQHAAQTLRQHDAAIDLRPREGQRLHGLPLRAGDQLDRTAKNLGHDGAGGQGQAQHHLHPVGERCAEAAKVQLEREHIGGEIDQHQRGRVAEDLHIPAHHGAHRLEWRE
ncbi:hypothetical protein SDC9_162191 [bioreactor metagenome]|uniref:Uncharacterized protein n=1 Tax=bioreactor metagenome TaxID=1076179 RepID=A0A645FMR7_9ZZZZ